MHPVTLTITFADANEAAKWLVARNVGAMVIPDPQPAAPVKPAKPVVELVKPEVGKPEPAATPAPVASPPTAETTAAPSPTAPVAEVLPYAALRKEVIKLGGVSRDAIKEVLADMGLADFKPLESDDNAARRPDALARVQAKLAALEAEAMA